MEDESALMTRFSAAWNKYLHLLIRKVFALKSKNNYEKLLDM